MDDTEKFDNFPLVDGSSVPFRRHITSPKGDDLLEFALTSGDGEVDGVKFDIVGTHSANIEVRFKVPGSKYGEHQFIMKARDFVKAAYEQLKKDLEA